MVPVTALLLPIVVSAVLVMIVSSIIHMFLPYHRTDYGPVPGEAQVMDDLRRANLQPGDYVTPYAATPKEMSAPEYVEKLKRGPVAFITVAPSGEFNMGRQMGLWFLYILIINSIAAYVTSVALGPTSDYANVFQIAGATAMVGYAFGRWQHSIWYFHSWSSTLKSTFDGIVYALVTAGAFGWLWPTA